MMQFYVVLMFIGVIMTFIQLVYFTASKRSVTNKLRELEEKKDGLEKILADAEFMVDELNRLSDYIVQQVEQKNNEVSATIMQLNERIDEYRAIESEMKRNLNAIKKNNRVIREETVAHAPAANVTNSTGAKIQASNPAREKVVSFSNKNSQVMNMAKMGLNDTEIAKNLNIGKGEIELIRGLNKADLSSLN